LRTTEKLRALARLLAAGSTRRAAARKLGVAERTIRRWTKLPGFAAELAKARARQERHLQRVQRRLQKRRAETERRRVARLHPPLHAESRDPERKPELRPEPKAAAQPEPARLAGPGGEEVRPRLAANAVLGVGLAAGLVRVESGDRSRSRWVERADLERLLAEGWRLVLRER
jgi:hypothetical protein